MNLRFGGFDVDGVDCIQHAWEHVSKNSYDLILLDIGLPDGSGLDLCQRIRNAGHAMPILFLSARTDEETVVKGMNLGADDYIRKPFGTEELKARMNKLLKRNVSAPMTLKAGLLTLDPIKRSAKCGSHTMTLSRREFDLLCLLARKKDETLTREFIIEHLSGDGDSFDRTIDSHMSHLRKKLREVAGESIRIVPVYGVGYRLEWGRAK